MSKTKKAAGTFQPAAPDPDPEVKDGASPVRLRALQNLTPEMAGSERRVYKGAEWDAPPERVHDLVKRRKIAEEV